MNVWRLLSVAALSGRPLFWRPSLNVRLVKVTRKLMPVYTVMVKVQQGPLPRVVKLYTCFEILVVMSPSDSFLIENFSIELELACLGSR